MPVILKVLPIGEMRTICFFAKANQTANTMIYWQRSDPSSVHSDGKQTVVKSFIEFKTNVPQG